MKYTKFEKVGNSSIEHIVEGDYEEVLAIFTEMNAKDAVEYQLVNSINFEDPSVTVLNQELYK